MGLPSKRDNQTIKQPRELFRIDICPINCECDKWGYHNVTFKLNTETAKKMEPQDEVPIDSIGCILGILFSGDIFCVESSLQSCNDGICMALSWSRVRNWIKNPPAHLI